MYLKRHLLIAFTMAVFTALAADGRSPRPHRRPSLSRGASQNWISGRRMWKNGTYPSPDGKYYVEVHGNGVDFALYKGRPSHQPHPPHSDLLGTVDPGALCGLVWVPRRPHTLVFASGDDPGYTMLALWNGGRHVRPLIRTLQAGDVESFTVDAVSRDGRTLIYDFTPGIGDGDHRRPVRRGRLRLP